MKHEDDDSHPSYVRRSPGGHPGTTTSVLAVVAAALALIDAMVALPRPASPVSVPAVMERPVGTGCAVAAPSPELLDMLNHD